MPDAKRAKRVREQGSRVRVSPFLVVPSHDFATCQISRTRSTRDQSIAASSPARGHWCAASVNAPRFRTACADSSRAARSRRWAGEVFGAHRARAAVRPHARKGSRSTTGSRCAAIQRRRRSTGSLQSNPRSCGLEELSVVTRRERDETFQAREVRRIVSCQVCEANPDFERRFAICSDASERFAMATTFSPSVACVRSFRTMCARGGGSLRRRPRLRRHPP